MLGREETLTFNLDEVPCQEISDPAVLSQTPVVSVGMITYNHEPYIAQAIEGVLTQETDFPIELVIGEDCSTDRTAEIVGEYQKKHPEIIRIITSDKNVGIKKNGWRTKEACRGKYIAYCEGDDFWHDPRKLQMQVDVMESDPECVLCFSRVRTYDVVEEQFRQSPFGGPRGNEEDRCQSLYEELMTDKNHVPTCSACVRKSVLAQVLQDCPECTDSTRPMGDTQWWLELSRRGTSVFLPELLATRNALAESASRSRSPKKELAFLRASAELRRHYYRKYPLSTKAIAVEERKGQLLLLRRAFKTRHFDVIDDLSGSWDVCLIPLRRRIALFGRKGGIAYWLAALPLFLDAKLHHLRLLASAHREEPPYRTWSPPAVLEMEQ